MQCPIIIQLFVQGQMRNVQPFFCLPTNHFHFDLLFNFIYVYFFQIPAELKEALFAAQK